MDTELRHIAVVGDCPMMRHGLCHLIDSVEDLSLVASCASISDFDISTTPAEIVILDLRLPMRELAGIVSGRLGRDRCAVVVISDPVQIDIASIVRAGVRGCLSRRADESETVAALRVIGSGGTFVSPDLTSYLLVDAGLLTDRERQVLELVAKGERDRDIALLLGVSENTVHSHLDRLRNKTGCRRRADLTRFALQQGLTYRSTVP
ncbi:response regulator transcription factor [Streptomyces tanashiensis]